MLARTACLYDAISSFKDYAAEAARLRALVEARARGIRPLLHVGCGIGSGMFTRGEAVGEVAAATGLEPDWDELGLTGRALLLGRRGA